MNADIARLIIGGIVGCHGIGHILGWLPAWGVTRFEGLSSRSWMLDGAIGEGASHLVGGALWLAPLLGFVLAAAGLFGGQGWWRQVAVASALVSLLAIALFWDALPAGSRFGAIAVDVVVLAGLLVVDWPSQAALGA